MRSNLFKALAVAVVSASCFGIISTAALAEKSGGILKFYHRGTPPSGSIHEEATSSTVVPYMSCLLYTSPSPRDATLSRMPSSA